MNHVVNKKTGFTIVELMFAMAFVATLLVAVAMTVIQIGNIYNRGITFKNVNQIGRLISSEVQRSITGGQSFNITTGIGSRFINQEWGGRLCTSQFTYVWNYGKAIQEGDVSRLNTYSDSTQTIRFIKIPDSNAKYCEPDVNGKYPSIMSINPLTLSLDALEMLATRNINEADENENVEYNLALHYFNISSTVDDLSTSLNEDTAFDPRTGQRLYSIEFLIGTNKEGSLTDDYQSCRLADELGADPSYCSVSRFNVLARAGNTVE